MQGKQDYLQEKQVSIKFNSIQIIDNNNNNDTHLSFIEFPKRAIY